MKIPSYDGRQYVSATQFRTYGATEFRLDRYEELKGCPRQYQAKYVEKRIPPERRSESLERGSVLHRALHVMERDMVGPEEALQQAWSTTLDISHWSDCVSILNAYLERGGPMTRYGTIDFELDLFGLLYEDPDFGPVWYRGVSDWIGIDLDLPGVLHGVDYKSNQFPPKEETVYGDVQLKGYAWLLRSNWTRWMPEGMPPQIVMHLDALRWRDVEVIWTDYELDEWQDWAIAVTRRILRDETGDPHLNPGCNWCPVSSDCPKILGLPKVGRMLGEREAGKTWDEQWAWRKQAHSVKTMLDRQIKAIDARLSEGVAANGGSLAFGDQLWEEQPGWEVEFDMVRLHELLGNRFYDLASMTKGTLEGLAKTVDPSTGAQILACIRNVPSGRKIVKKTVG